MSLETRPASAHLVSPEPMIGALLRVPFEAVNLHVNAALQGAGFTDISPAHQRVFQVLPPEGIRLTALAERAQVTKQSMGALVDHLEMGGYLERVMDPTDRRASFIRRTERGWRVEQTARASIQQLEMEWGRRLGAAKLRLLHELLRELVAIVES